MISKKRKLYYAFVIMLTFVASLAAVSFAYYTPDSSYSVDLSVSSNMVKISSDDLVDNEVIVDGNSTKEIKVYIINGADTESRFKLYYESATELLDVYTKNIVKESISGNEMQEAVIVLENYDENPAVIKLDVKASSLDQDIEVDGNLVRIGE